MGTHVGQCHKLQKRVFRDFFHILNYCAPSSVAEMNVQSHFHHQTLRWQIKTEAFPSPFPLMAVVATNQ